MASTVAPLITTTGPLDYLWLLILGFIIAFVLAFSVGANDVAILFGATVGSGVVTLKQASILTVFETKDSVLLRTEVSTTIQNGLINMEMYNPAQDDLFAVSHSSVRTTSVLQIVTSLFLGPFVLSVKPVVSALWQKWSEDPKWYKLIEICCFHWPLHYFLVLFWNFILPVHTFILHKADPVSMVHEPCQFSIPTFLV
jgi:sodium-dependent phosphate transporter